MKTRIEELDELIGNDWAYLEKNGYDQNVVLHLINLNLEKNILSKRLI